MTAREILQYRLCHQYITASPAKTPAEVVTQLCAIQAQDFAGAKWSIGLRAPGLTDAAVEEAIADKTIIRLSSLRGTIHFLAAEDVRWVGELIKPRMVAASGSFYNSIGLSEPMFSKSHAVIRKTLEGGRQASRDELKEALEKKKIDTSGHRMNHFISRAGVDLVICCAPRRGKEFIYTLLDEWLPPAAAKQTGQDGLARLAWRYFTGHGPATAQDFAWWSGFTLTAVKAAIQSLGQSLQKITFGGQEYWMVPASAQAPSANQLFLLPGFDEYYIGYSDRGLLSDEATLKKLIPPNGILQPTIVANGRIAGTWKRTMKKNTLQLEASFFSPFSDPRKKAMVKRSAEFGAFMGMPVEWI
ncbi:winged helix DNA-binding domain-containing protein [Chitinophaga alhagiae]|uniref:Winged helix DNA-binding domain-containing protein n=1 Tax=Chitinophaga alhagiae TaxID=2203219 RepID=A0ABN5LZ34_9BACT|nr:winged helix DNA-binding domain-containing protein [Chitinophaga alhagiae]AWO01542.1 winged helix DNA-binding domain-containing protein [Chitinophaga alhagiae]